jgi:RHS repeat-associated protein
VKYNLTLALMALITGTAFGSMPAALPEFKNEKQLAEWRAEMAAKPAPQTIATEDHAFYTGKPYVESSGGDAFKYRSYNPELARWTSEDPSGFPDGANIYCYINNQATNSYDYLGLKKVLWLMANGGDPTVDTEIYGIFTKLQSEYKAKLVALDAGSDKPHYLDDGDTFDVNRIAAFHEIAAFNDSYDQVYMLVHGAVDGDGLLTGGYIVGGAEFGSHVFDNFKHLKMAYGCNPVDGFIKTADVVAKFKDPTKAYLYE